MQYYLLRGYYNLFQVQSIKVDMVISSSISTTLSYAGDALFIIDIYYGISYDIANGNNNDLRWF